MLAHVLVQELEVEKGVVLGMELVHGLVVVLVMGSVEVLVTE